MKAFLTRPKRKSSPELQKEIAEPEESTEVKLALLSSLHPQLDQEILLDILLAHDGSVAEASASLRVQAPVKKGTQVIGYQQSLKQYATPSDSTSLDSTPKKKKLKSKAGSTLHLYDPEDVAEHTPCTIIHNFLPAEDANELLQELLEESKSFEKITFQLFENVVSSPHTSSFYVESYDEIERQKTEYHYNGGRLTDVRRITPQLIKVKPKVQEAVNSEIQKRIKTRYPGGKKLKYQSPNPWVPNSAFVNAYTGPQQNVGWHSDHLTYLGPRAVIGSISLGVAREFRVRRIVPRDSDAKTVQEQDAQGQISIHLPHNSLLVMHAEMQEEWKHSIAPALSIDPHPISGTTRINITYRDYKANLHPRSTPKCRCGLPCVLRAVTKKKDNLGKYFWMCYANSPGQDKCGFFQWAEFDDDGNPLFRKGAGTKT
ncbi:related to CUE domain protein [Fusarium fujikuroi IMI 58289]|uniref:Related to CUE domain protein n=1 Tax=Gibberella fujikuroi (strain CBS 195.34 / IMI 58289 / NRRL A-6831) TaxID=1279085 RepID=S0DMI4_GIBF5|nr:related to CUE domain protein [Fusarium fujikuroi IMI 58289]CCT63829.1 related to CUE domain protein [Fusarium fujikuroi IMI 58289]SCN98854.1 related to CUE domain protein [Fusarium fujikuroi]